MIMDCRKRLQKLFNGEQPEHFIFTANCSDGLNLALKGLVLHQLKQGKKPHCICTCIDHNSVLRPLAAMEELGWITQTRVPVDGKTGLVDPEAIRKAIRPETCLIAATHASNVTGTVQAVRKISAITREHISPSCWMPPSRSAMWRSTSRPTGSTSWRCRGTRVFWGPLGTRRAYIRPGIEKIMQPLKEGGTGTISEQPRQPDFMPDRFESGSHNAIGIAGLSEGVQWLMERGMPQLVSHDRELMATFIEGISVVEIPGLKYFGPQGVGESSGRLLGVGWKGSRRTSLLWLSRAGMASSPGRAFTVPPWHMRPSARWRPMGTTRFSFGPFLWPPM